MPQARDHGATRATTSTNRRNLLAGASAALVAGAVAVAAHGAPASPGADAELIRMCAEFERLEGQYRAAHNLHADDDEALDAALTPITAAQDPICDRIVATPAATVDGMRAKARALVAYAPEILHPEHDDRLGLVASILGDLLGRTA